MSRIRLLSALVAALLIVTACESSPSAPESADPSGPVYDGGNGGTATDSAKMGGQMSGSGG